MQVSSCRTAEGFLFVDGSMQTTMEARTTARGKSGVSMHPQVLESVRPQTHPPISLASLASVEKWAR